MDQTQDVAVRQQNEPDSPAFRKGASLAQGTVDKVAADNGWTRREISGTRLAADEYRRSPRRLDVAWTSDGRVHSCNVHERGTRVRCIVPGERGKLSAVLIELTQGEA